MASVSCTNIGIIIILFFIEERTEPQVVKKPIHGDRMERGNRPWQSGFKAMSLATLDHPAPCSAFFTFWEHPR